MRKSASYAISIFGVLGIAVVLLALRDIVNPTTIALCFLLVILFIAAAWGSIPAYVGSVIAMLCLNFFFLPPYHTFVIADPQNWIALASFLLTALIAGELSARARRRAEEAEAGRKEIERLYNQLREAFERASMAEALKQSERLKSALLDAVTHDIRTPLTSMKAAVTSLLGKRTGLPELDDEGQRELLEVIDAEADRLDRFVESLVEVARIEAGEMRLRRKWISLEEIVSQALKRAATITAQHQIQVELPPDLPPVSADGSTLSEVVYVLVDNAAKYSPTGSKIRISAWPQDSAIRVEVKDEGRGVPADMRDRVFEKFFRIPLKPSVPHRPAGMGMGLAIARGIVEAHGGKIWIEGGQNGKGTLVKFTVPLENPPGGYSVQSL